MVVQFTHHRWQSLRVHATFSLLDRGPLVRSAKLLVGRPGAMHQVVREVDEERLVIGLLPLHEFDRRIGKPLMRLGEPDLALRLFVMQPHIRFPDRKGDRPEVLTFIHAGLPALKQRGVIQHVVELFLVVRLTLRIDAPGDHAGFLHASVPSGNLELRLDLLD